MLVSGFVLAALLPMAAVAQDVFSYLTPVSTVAVDVLIEDVDGDGGNDLVVRSSGLIPSNTTPPNDRISVFLNAKL